jgi:hypothetical protein
MRHALAVGVADLVEHRGRLPLWVDSEVFRECVGAFGPEPGRSVSKLLRFYLHEIAHTDPADG